MADHVYFFSTCLVEHLFPKVGLDSIALLSHFKYHAVLPNYPTCCAQPAYNSGAINEAQAVAKNTIDALSEYDYPVIVPSASCADMIQHHYPTLLADDTVYADKALALAQRCHEFVQFLSEHLSSAALRSSDLPPTKSVSTDKPMIGATENKNLGLHISCSARRGTQSTRAWVNAAALIAPQSCNPDDVQSHEPKYAQECCGFGGTFSVKAPEISAQMAQDKLRELSKCGAEFVSGDCGCLMHLNGYSEKNNLPIKGEHLISRLAKHYGVGDD